ncbi:MAG: hypothetical protein ABIH23_36175 [bacterium]
MGITELLKPRKKMTRAKKEQGPNGTKAEATSIILDHPQKGEKITSPHYTLRIGTLGKVDRVEISIDQGPWQACRHSVGYWWYDWAGYAGGRHYVVAKAQTKDGQDVASETRKFQVALETAEKPQRSKKANS